MNRSRSIFPAMKIISVLLVVFASTARAQSFPAPPVLFPAPLSPRIANYDIAVRLEPETRMLYGKEILTWKNTSQDEITELQFHLYLNAFRNNRSTFMIESGGAHRGFKLEKDGWGYIEVDRITRLPGDGGEARQRLSQLREAESDTLIPGEDLTALKQFIQPDTPEHVHDKTVMRVPLREPLPPGQTISLYIEFTARLPQPPFARTGAKNEYFFVGQWFPKIGVYTPQGWNCHQFHSNSEFFADFGVYNVWITVPEENIVGATGLQVGEPLLNGDGSATHYYHAEDVHDFAWTTSPEYVEFKGKAQDVDIRVLMQPDHVGQGARYVEAAKVAVEYFQNWYGDYPFPNLTVVDPRRGAGGSGGMEYPTLITAMTRYGLPEGIRLVEMVIIHEFGHNYWYHLLASNEFEESWLDEGINTYTEIQIMADKYGPGNGVDFMGLKIDDLSFQRFQYLMLPDADPIYRKAWEFYSGRSYGINSYSKPGLVLTTLQNLLGRETMDKIMRTYVERWRFKHPTSYDFIDVANEVSGQDLNWFFDQAIFKRYTLDFAVTRAISRPYKKAKGYDFEEKTREAVPDTAAPDTTAPEIINTDSLEALVPDSLADTTLYYSEVKLRRLGEFVCPVEIEMVFANWDTLTEHWDGKSLWKKYTYLRPSRLLSAEIDPQQKLVLDLNFTNNSRVVKPRFPDRLGANKLAVRFLFWMQVVLEQPEFLNWFTIPIGF